MLDVQGQSSPAFALRWEWESKKGKKSKLRDLTRCASHQSFHKDQPHWKVGVKRNFSIEGNTSSRYPVTWSEKYPALVSSHFCWPQRCHQTGEKKLGSNMGHWVQMFDPDILSRINLDHPRYGVIVYLTIFPGLRKVAREVLNLSNRMIPWYCWYG